jgi:rubrerythrin
MDSKEFQEIIDFAIDLENKAAENYKSMQGMTKYDSSRKMLKELEDMERNHARILENIDQEEAKDYTPQNIPDLKLSNFMVDEPPKKNMTYQEVILHAMKTEEHANNLYKTLAGNAENESVRNVFLRLADEEAKHKLSLEKIYDDEVLREN